MIELHIEPGGLRMVGHAGHGQNGQDIVCSAISALTCGLVMGLEEIAQVKLSSTIKSGYTDIKWSRLGEIGEALVNSWYLSLMAINDQYNCIKIV